MLKLTESNYYSPDANVEYFSASQVKRFMQCPAMAMAEITGEYTHTETAALQIGSFVDAMLTGDIDAYAANHPEIRKKNGELRAEFERAVDMCDRAGRDKLFMDFMRGEHQRILTGEIKGIPFKAKLDVIQDGKRIVDLKTCRSFEPQYKPGSGKVSFVEAWNYDLQMAIYQHLEGHKLPCYIAAITKEPVPDIAIIEIPQHYMDAAMAVLMENIEYYDAIKRNQIEPDRCERCDWCKQTKVLTKPQTIEEFEMEDVIQ